jgi:DNA polymerase-4
MTEHPFTLDSYPRAIIHVDGDAFFTSIEQAMHPALKGKPVVTGKERGIIAAASYEAKALGVTRGIQLWEAERKCPELVVLPSDYETYALYSKRMFNIIRNYSPFVEESSVDEGFADISGMRRVLKMSYEQIALKIQEDIKQRLDVTVSVGLSITKSLAKLASDYRKPEGFTAVPGIHIHHFLKKIAVGDIWGIGRNGVQLLSRHGVKTAYQFVKREEKWVQKLFGKPGKEIWNELRGNLMWPINTEARTSYLSVSKCKTFSSASEDRDYIQARLIRNVESSFIKLRRFRLRAREVHVYLRRADHSQYGVRAFLNRSTLSAQEALPLILEMFEHLLEKGKAYRSTTIVLTKLESDETEQYELFQDKLQIEKLAKLSDAVDDINKKCGKHKVSLGTSLLLDNHPKNARDDPPWRKDNLLEGETERKRINIPRVDVTI